MTPDAAGIVAQVDVGLLIALTVEARSSHGSTESQRDEITSEGNTESQHNEPANNHAWVHLVGIIAVFISLSITLASVVYAKPLQGLAEHIATDAVAVGVAPLFFSAVDRLIPQIGNPLKLVALVVLALGLSIWFLIWWQLYVPGGFFS